MGKTPFLDYAALLASDGHGLAAQLRVRRLLDGGEEGIRVEMNDDAHGAMLREGNGQGLSEELTPGRGG